VSAVNSQTFYLPGQRPKTAQAYGHSNPFRNPRMKMAYLNVLISYHEKTRLLYDPQGERHQGNSQAMFFWRGYEGGPGIGVWDADSRMTFAYAEWRCGRAVRQRELEEERAEAHVASYRPKRLGRSPLNNRPLKTTLAYCSCGWSDTCNNTKKEAESAYRGHLSAQPLSFVLPDEASR
jgi:hypothetical protein